MSKVIQKEERHIHPEMTVLDVISRHRCTEAVFKNMTGMQVCASVARPFSKL